MKETLAFHISALYHDFLAYTTEELKKFGLSFGQMPFIIYVGKHNGCTQAELTRELKLDWGYSQRTVARLVSNDFMIKKYESEKSCNCLSLTPNGIKAFNACHNVFYSWDSLNAKELSAEEKENLISLLNKITAGEKGSY